MTRADVPTYRVAGWNYVARQPNVGYCLAGVATRSSLPAGLHWDNTAPTLARRHVLLVLGPASCAFLGGAGAPAIADVVASGTDVVVHVHYPTPFSLSLDEAVAAIVPEPSPGGRLVVVVHGSIMQPPGRWEDAKETVLAIEGVSSP